MVDRLPLDWFCWDNLQETMVFTMENIGDSNESGKSQTFPGVSRLCSTITGVRTILPLRELGNLIITEIKGLSAIIGYITLIILIYNMVIT